jgi:hypothetical protein
VCVCARACVREQVSCISHFVERDLNRGKRDLNGGQVSYISHLEKACSLNPTA